MFLNDARLFITQKLINVLFEKKFVIKIDDINYLNLLNLDNFAEVIYLISPQSDISALNKLPKNKIRKRL